MAANTADISGISVSSSAAWSPDMTSAPRLKPVTMMIAASASEVARIVQTCHPYSKDRLIQIKWNGTVAHSRSIRIPATLTRTKIHQPISTRYRRHKQPIRSAKVNPVAHAANGGDHVRFQLRPQSPDVYVDHVRLRVEAVAPDRRQEALLGNRAARMLHELGEEHRLPPCQPHGPGPRVRLLADRVKYDLGGGENMRIRQAPVPDPRLDPGQQLIQHERLGQVVVGAHFEALHLRRGVGQAGEHDHCLTGPKPHQPAQDGHAVGAWHQQVEDDDAIGTRECQPQPLFAVGGRVDLQALAAQGPGDEAEHPRLVVYRENTIAHLRSRVELTLCHYYNFCLGSGGILPSVGPAGRGRRKPGRPPTVPSIARLVVRLAKEHPLPSTVWESYFERDRMLVVGNSSASAAALSSFWAAFRAHSAPACGRAACRRADGCSPAGSGLETRQRGLSGSGQRARILTFQAAYPAPRAPRWPFRPYGDRQPTGRDTCPQS